MKLMFSLDGFTPMAPGLPSPFPDAVAGESTRYGAVWTIDVDRLEDLGRLALEIDPPEIGMEEGHFTTCFVEVNTDDLWCVTFGWHALGEEIDDPFDPNLPLDFFDDEDVHGIGEMPDEMIRDLAEDKLTSQAPAREPHPELSELGVAVDRAELALVGALGVPSAFWESDTDA